MNIVELIIIVAVIVALTFALRYLHRHPLEDGCNGSCASCGKRDGCRSDRKENQDQGS